MKFRAIGLVFTLVFVLFSGIVVYSKCPLANVQENNAVVIDKALDIPTVSKNERKPVVILFTQKNCASCVKFQLTYENLKRHHGNHYKFVELDAYKNIDLTKKFNVRVTPSLFIYDKKNNYVESIDVNADKKLTEYLRNRR